MGREMGRGCGKGLGDVFGAESRRSRAGGGLGVPDGRSSAVRGRVRAWDGGGRGLDVRVGRCSAGGWLGGYGDGTDVMCQGGGSGVSGVGAREGGGGGAIGRYAGGRGGRCRSWESARVTGGRHAESGVDQLESVHLRGEGLTFLSFGVVEGCLETGVMVQWRWTQNLKDLLVCTRGGRRVEVQLIAVMN